MQSLKDKMCNYEVEPHTQSWQIIATALDEDKTDKKRGKIFYLSLAIAAAVTIFIFSFIFLGDTGGKTGEITTASSKKISKNAGEPDDKITIPGAASNETSTNETAIGKGNAKSETNSKKYLTISGPQGQPVKISIKAAKLIISSDNQNPPKPVWSAKVNKWKDIMKTNILAPATANFLDIVELTHALKVSD